MFSTQYESYMTRRINRIKPHRGNREVTLISATSLPQIKLDLR